MDTQKQQIVDNLKQANNILVTVSNNPSVDQLAACVGLTLALNKMKKHATAVFSGAIPPIIEFLQPEKTLEKTTDSLRDFIIAIDKAKADKLRYKVEDKFVKIFITPYRTSISEKDLQFSEGDFNVDVVLALGVHKQTDLDQAITAHGRILHDATIISVNIQPNNELGSINLVEQQASSLSEVAVELLNLLDKSMIDGQVATTLLTGIVAETDRFRNAKTTPATMSISAELLTAGANQQLVASKLEARPVVTPLSPQSGPPSSPQSLPSTSKPDDGTLEIHHDERGDDHRLPVSAGSETPNEPKPPQIHIDENGQVHDVNEHKTDGAVALNVPSPMSGPITPPPFQPLAPPPQSPPLSPPLTVTPPPPSFGGMPPLAPPPPSPLNPFASRVSGPSSGLGLPPLPPLPSNGGQGGTPPPLESRAPEIIQPDLNAIRAQQKAEPTLPPLAPPNLAPPTIRTEGPRLMTQPPTFGSELTAETTPQEQDEDIPSGQALSLPQVEKPGLLLNREPLQPQPPLPPLEVPVSVAPTPSPSLPPPPLPKVEPSPASPAPGGGPTEPPLLAEESLTSLERDVKSPHLDYIESPAPGIPSSSPSSNGSSPASAATMQPARPADDTSSLTPNPADHNQAADVANARSAVSAAFGDALEPVASLNAQPLGSPLHENDEDAPPPGFSSDPNSSGTPPPPPVPPPLIPPVPS